MSSINPVQDDLRSFGARVHSLASRTRTRLAFLKDLAQRRSLERFYRADPPPIAYGAEKVLVVEGLWDNPNHWFRLWLFLHAFLAENRADVVAVLRSDDNWDDWRKRKSLEALGVHRFVYLGHRRADAAHDRAARDILSEVSTLRDMLSLELPDELPAYVFFDTVLKLARNPQPSLQDNDLWRSTLTETFRLGAFYRELFDSLDVCGVASSHAWKSEWATLCWTALRRGIPFHYMTSHYDSLRIRRMRSTSDYRAPNEHMRFEDFLALPAAVQERVVRRGEQYLGERFQGSAEFIVLRYSVRPEQRTDRASLLRRYGFDVNKPTAVVYAHSWYDFPHTQAMTNFTEPLDWIRYTIDCARTVPDVNWAIKPHPCDSWYGDIKLSELVSSLPANAVVLPEDSDSLAFLKACDAVVTIQGSVAIEAAAFGKTVLCADRGTYSAWGFAHVAESREHYADLLRDIARLPPATQEQSRRAMAYAATALAPPPRRGEWLKMTCDSRFLEGTLYDPLRRTLSESRAAIEAETAKVRAWLLSPHDSYNVWRVIRQLEGADA